MMKGGAHPPPRRVLSGSLDLKGWVGRPRRPLTDHIRALLDQAFEAQLEGEDARRRRDQHALAAARAGATWREIGAAVAMSPQAARQRYHHLADQA
jgi:hypothetical protein